jgi:hypothetical protein
VLPTGTSLNWRVHAVGVTVGVWAVVEVFVAEGVGVEVMVNDLVGVGVKVKVGMLWLVEDGTAVLV